MFSAGRFTLEPIGVTVTFTVTISGSGITAITGTITLVGGGTVPGPNPVTGGSGDRAFRGSGPAMTKGTTAGQGQDSNRR
jgi:hypothetical protein